MSDQKINIENLFNTLKEKIETKEKGSYTAILAEKGLEVISRKVGEEAVEVVVASFMDQQENSEKTHKDLVNEICDLLYHLLVLMAHQDIDLSEVATELNNRNKDRK